LKRIAREAERREPERAAGLLGKRWMREPSNSQRAQRAVEFQAAASMKRVERGFVTQRASAR